MRLDHVRLVAANELRDLVRQRGVWMQVLVVPALFAAFLLTIPQVLEGRHEKSLAETTYTIAVEPGVDPALVAELGRRSRPGLRPIEVADAQAAVEGDVADAGLRVQAGAPDLEAVALPSRRRSRVAAEAVVDAVQARSQGDSRVTVEVADVDDTAKGARYQLTRSLAAPVVYPLSFLLQIVAGTLSLARSGRTLEPMLLLPIRRRDHVLGRSLAGLAVGAAIVPATALAIAMSSRFTKSDLAMVASDSGVLVAVAVASVALIPFYVACGLFGAAAARTPSQAGLVGLVAQLPFFAVFFFQMAGIQLEGPIAAVLPIVGPLAVLRTMVLGTVTGVELGLAGLATVAWTALALAGAVRFFGADRAVLRATG